MEILSNVFYKTVFSDYPELLDVMQVSKILEVSTKTVYKLLKENTIQYMKVGREYRVSKYHLLKYLKLIAEV